MIDNGDMHKVTASKPRDFYFLGKRGERGGERGGERKRVFFLLYIEIYKMRYIMREERWRWDGMGWDGRGGLGDGDRRRGCGVRYETMNE
jgi:hypothetical protein